MRILIVNHFPFEGSGSGTYAKNLASELSDRGHAVKAVFPENTKLPPDAYRFEIRPIYFKSYEDLDYDIHYNFPCFTTHPRSNNTYYELTDEEMHQYIDTFVKIVKEEAQKFKPDIIHAQHLWITPYAASQTPIPYVVTAHGTDLKGFKKDPRYHPYALEGAKKAKKVITISKQVDREVKALYGIEDEARELILNGYDQTLFHPMEISKEKVLKKFGIDTVPKYIVSFAGKLTHFKGADVLLKAAKIYENSFPGEIATLIVGNGELYDELNQLKSELSLQNVFFLGHIPQKSLAEIYNIADVHVVPSRVEPFGLVAVEALACGAPVVGTNQGGLADFIHPDVGQLVDVDDDLALSEAIQEELTREDKSLRRRKASQYAAENFSWKKTIDALEKLYAQAIKK
ncbi:MAG TPA: glycosyltransferase family 4 protein [Clostridiales bacterium]|nr:glycosyltransferase family 4 protein [Clostridiales bacterium]